MKIGRMLRHSYDARNCYIDKSYNNPVASSNTILHAHIHSAETSADHVNPDDLELFTLCDIPWTPLPLVDTNISRPQLDQLGLNTTSASFFGFVASAWL